MAKEPNLIVFRENNPVNTKKIDISYMDDNRLSMGAKGLYLYMASQPEEKEITITELEQASTDGLKDLMNYLEELIQYGYVSKEK